MRQKKEQWQSSQVTATQKTFQTTWNTWLRVILFWPGTIFMHKYYGQLIPNVNMVVITCIVFSVYYLFPPQNHL